MPEAQDQVALPAWLESLRAGERSAAPVNNTPPFSAPNFVEEGSLPSWMRPERGEGSGNTDANPVVSAYPGQGAAAQAGQEITAQSLVDENALPPWLREGKIAPVQSSPAQSIQASSLVEQEDVPEWMKTLQPQSSTPFSSERRSEPKPAVAGQPLSGMSAHDLIDPQSVPDWMKAQGDQGNTSASRGMAQDTVVGGQQSAQTTQRNSGQSTPNQMAGFSAASLLDENALPQWLRESGSNARQSNQSAISGASNGRGNSVPSPSYPAASNTGSRTPMQDNSWSAQVPPQTPMSGSAGAPSQQGQGMPASSFIDEDALPPWLRTADQQQGASSGSAYGSQIGSSMGSQVRQAPIAPRHVDNVRVPNRPRNENGFSDTSESAANVFASMLGVASAAPNYLGQQLSTPQPQPSQSFAPGQSASNYRQDYRAAQGNVSFSGNQQGNPSFNAGNNGAPNTPMGGMPQGYSANAAMPNSLNSANAGSGYAVGQPGWSGNVQQSAAGGQGMGGGMPPQMVGVANTNAANVPNAMNNYGAPPSSAQMADQSGDQKGKKRGLFGAFLDWLSR